MRGLGDALHLGRRVHGAHLGGLGEADRPGRHVGGAGAGLVDRPGEVGGRDLAVHHRQRNRARVAPRPELGPAAFAAVDVSGVGHVDGPVGRGDDRRAEPIGGRPGAHGVDLDLGLEQLREALREPLGAGVGAVGRAVAGIGGDDRLQDLGGGAGHVVAVEVLLHAHAGLLGSTGLDDTTAGRGGIHHRRGRTWRQAASLDV